MERAPQERNTEGSECSGGVDEGKMEGQERVVKPKPKLTKAERREIQERQRAAKASARTGEQATGAAGLSGGKHGQASSLSSPLPGSGHTATGQVRASVGVMLVWHCSHARQQQWCLPGSWPFASCFLLDRTVKSAALLCCTCTLHAAIRYSKRRMTAFLFLRKVLSAHIIESFSSGVRR